MRRWICTLLLVLFATNVAFAAHGSLARAVPDGPQMASLAVEPANEIVAAVSQCCMENQAKGQGTPCAVDCT